MKVYRSTKHPHTTLTSLYIPSGNAGRWNNLGEKVLYCSECIENAMAEFSFHHLTNKLIKEYKSSKGAYNKIPNVANSICAGIEGCLLSFNIVSNGNLYSLTSQQSLTMFCSQNGINKISEQDYMSDGFYLNQNRNGVLKSMLSSRSNIFAVHSARSNICNNLLIHSDKFTIGDFANLTRKDFKVFPVRKNVKVTDLRKGFDLDYVLIEISGQNNLILKTKI